MSQISSTMMILRKVFFVVTRGKPSSRLYFDCVPKILVTQVPVRSSLWTQLFLISWRSCKYCFIKKSEDIIYSYYIQKYISQWYISKEVISFSEVIKNKGLNVFFYYGHKQLRPRFNIIFSWFWKSFKSTIIHKFSFCEFSIFHRWLKKFKFITMIFAIASLLHLSLVIDIRNK